MLLLVGMLLLFPPLFVLGPLAGLLAASRPRTFREWCWIAAALMWVGLTAMNPGGVATQTIYAWALCVTGSFVLLMLASNATIVTGSLLAIGVSFLLTTLWLHYLQMDWRAVQFAVEHATQAQWTESINAAGTDYFGNREDVKQAMRIVITAASGVLPAVLALAILPGLAVAWTWYRRLAGVPLGAPAQRFAEFRFSDQLIWGVVLGAIAMVLPVPAPLDAVAANFALVIGTLYLARGTAVIWSRIQGLPAPLLAILLLLVLVSIPVSIGAAFALGLADTWVDFRRRAVPDQKRE